MALTWIYLIRDNDTGFYKIGRSVDPLDRLKQLMRQDTLQPRPNDFVLVEAWWAEAETEKHLHGRYQTLRKRGEWFDLGREGRADVEVFFDTYQPFSVTHKPGSLETLLKAARREISQLRHDLQIANLKIKKFTEIVARNREYSLPKQKTLDEIHQERQKLLESTRLKDRKII